MVRFLLWEGVVCTSLRSVFEKVPWQPLGLSPTGASYVRLPFRQIQFDTVHVFTGRVEPGCFLFVEFPVKDFFSMTGGETWITLLRSNASTGSNKLCGFVGRRFVVVRGGFVI